MKSNIVVRSSKGLRQARIKGLTSIFLFASLIVGWSAFVGFLAVVMFDKVYDGMSGIITYTVIMAVLVTTIVKMTIDFKVFLHKTIYDVDGMEIFNSMLDGTYSPNSRLVTQREAAKIALERFEQNGKK